MSTEDSNIRPLTPVTFYGEAGKTTDGIDSPYTDFRAMVTPVEEEKAVPKGVYVPESASSSESPTVIVETVPEKPAPTPVGKGSGASKGPATSPPASSSPTKNGS